jgi:hypothetical protein
MKRVNPTRCPFCVGGLVYDGAPDATGTPSYQCDSCNGTGKVEKQSNVQRLVQWLEAHPERSIDLVFTVGSLRQPIGQLSIFVIFDGANTRTGVLLQAETATEVVDDVFAGTLLEMLPPHVGLAA